MQGFRRLFHLERPDQLIKETRYTTQYFVVRCSGRSALKVLDPTPFDQVGAIGGQKLM
jgi:hypothetical protein